MLFFLIAMRMFGFIFLNPILGRRNIPAIAKTGLALVLAVLIYTTQSAAMQDFSVDSSLEFAVLLLKEFAVGYLLGFLLELLDMVFTFAGTLIDFQMGISMAQVYDPQNGAQIALSGKILQIYYTLIFFAVDGHLALMKILLDAGQLLPYGEVAISTHAAQLAIDIFYDCVVLAVKISFPMIAFEFILEIVVGVLMTVNPQVNLFILSIQLRLLCGFILMIILIDPLNSVIGDVISDMMRAMSQMLKVAGG